MEKKILIVTVPRGWIVVSEKGARLSGLYGSPQQALEIARPLATAQGAEIVIYPQQKSFHSMRRKRLGKTNRKKQFSNAYKSEK